MDTFSERTSESKFVSRFFTLDALHVWTEEDNSISMRTGDQTSVKLSPYEAVILANSLLRLAQTEE